MISANPSPILVESVEWKRLDRGVALFLRSPRLNALREKLADEWAPWLSRQDSTRYRPHVTIQNKAEHAKAEQTHHLLAAEGPPPNISGIGLHLWIYRNGPWEDVQVFRFRRR